MKKALSLIVAVVMVALMIPFATFMTAAVDTALPLPEGYSVTNANAEASTDYALNEHGIALNKASSFLYLEDKTSGARVVEIDYAMSKGDLQYLYLVYSDQMKGTSTSSDDWSGARFVLNTNTHTSAASYLPKTITATAGKTTKKENTQVVSATSGKHWGEDPNFKTALKGVPGKLESKGIDLKLYLEIDVSNNIEKLHLAYVCYDDGMYAGSDVFTADFTGAEQKADKYLGIYSNRAGLIIQSIKITAGSYGSTTGEPLYSMDFVEFAKEASIKALLEAYNLDTFAFSAPEKAVTYKEVNKLCFASALSEECVQDVFDMATSYADNVKKVTFGTLIVTRELAEIAGAVTFDALNAVTNKTDYIDITSTLGYWYVDTEEVNTYAASVEVVSGSENVEYCSVGYLKVELADGEIMMIYSDVKTAKLSSVKPA